jgi:hypothetical protein
MLASTSNTLENEMTRMITFDPDALDEIDALYLVDLLNNVLAQDGITEALEKAAWELAEHEDDARGETSTFDLADRIYPQVSGIWTEDDSHRLTSKRNEHLRRFGFLKEVAE